MQRSQDDQSDDSPQPMPAVSSEERQMDNQYRDLMLQRQVLNYQRQRVLSLQDITLNLVVQIVKQCAHNKQDPRPLDQYPGPLLDLVYDKLSEQDEYGYDMTMHFDIVKQTITQRSRQVKFTLLPTRHDHYKPPWSAWTCEKVQSVLALLRDKCKNQLTKLDIDIHRYSSEAVRPSLPQIHELVRHQANLTELSLAYCDIINDKTLAVISSTCHNLRYLDVRGNEKVTDKGLQYLIRGPEGDLSKITYLGIYRTAVTGHGIANFMFELQAQLECVETYGGKMPEALVELCQLKEPVQLPKYKSLCHIEEKTPNLVNTVSMMPNVTSLELDNPRDVTPLLMLTKVTDLNLRLTHNGQKNCNLLSEKLIPQWSSYLTHVNLCNNSGSEIVLDFSVFTQCPNLEELCLEGLSIQVKTNHELLPSSFSKLRSYKVYRNLPDEIVSKMLTSPCLEKFHVHLVPEHVIRYVISEARTNPQIFSKLERLYSSSTSDYTLDTWIQLVCVVPDNTHIYVFDELLGKFVRRNNINVIIH